MTAGLFNGGCTRKPDKNPQCRIWIILFWTVLVLLMCHSNMLPKMAHLHDLIWAKWRTITNKCYTVRGHTQSITKKACTVKVLKLYRYKPDNYFKLKNDYNYSYLDITKTVSYFIELQPIHLIRTGHSKWIVQISRTGVWYSNDFHSRPGTSQLVV